MAKFRKKRSRSRSFRGFARRVRSASRRSYRTVRRFGRRAGRSTLGGWLPSSMNESMVNFASGASMPLVSGFVAPYTDGLLGSLGNYQDEARTAIIGVAAYKLGSGFIKQMGKAYFDYAVTSAGIQTAGNLNLGTGNSGASGSTSAYV